MALSAGLRVTAQRLISKHGGSATITRGTGSYDPISGDMGAGETTFSMRAVAQPAGRSAETLVGSLVGRRVQQFYIAGPSAVMVGDRIAFSGASWTVLHVTVYDHDGTGPIITEAFGEA